MRYLDLKSVEDIEGVSEKLKKETNDLTLKSSKLDLSSIGGDENNLEGYDLDSGPNEGSSNEGSSNEESSNKTTTNFNAPDKPSGGGVVGGAMQGAALGTTILPGWGTAIGGVIGGISGALQSNAEQEAYQAQVNANLESSKGRIESDTNRERQQILNGYANRLAQSLIR